MDRLKKLTEPQREVLRYVAKGYESKEIGKQLGLSHHSVNRRIERAIQALGVTTRKEAARYLANAEGKAYEPLAHNPIHPTNPPQHDMVSKSDEQGQVGFPWPFATQERHDGLGLEARLFWALLGIPVIVMLAWGAFLAGINALDSLGF